MTFKVPSNLSVLSKSSPMIIFSSAVMIIHHCYAHEWFETLQSSVLMRVQLSEEKTQTPNQAAWSRRADGHGGGQEDKRPITSPGEEFQNLYCCFSSVGSSRWWLGRRCSSC